MKRPICIMVADLTLSLPFRLQRPKFTEVERQFLAHFLHSLLTYKALSNGIATSVSIVRTDRIISNLTLKCHG